MKSDLITAAGMLLMISVSTGLLAMAPAATGKDDGSQAHSGEITASDIQSRDNAAETSSPAAYELFLEKVRINSKNQAAEAVYNLSVIAANRNDYALARALVEEAMLLNQANPNFLTFAADIAFLTQDYDKAEVYQLKVLEVARTAMEVDDLQVAMILDQLAAIHVKQGDYEKAESSLLEGLQLREKILGDSHLEVAMTLSKLASLATHQHQADVAEARLKRALRIVRDVSGPRHADSATMLAILADFYQGEARLEEAEELYKEALSIWDESSSDPLSQAVCENSLGRLFLSQGRFDDALVQFEQALLLLKQNYAEDHPYVQQATHNLAVLDAERSRSAEEDAIYNELVREFSVRSTERM